MFVLLWFSHLVQQGADRYCFSFDQNCYAAYWQKHLPPSILSQHIIKDFEGATQGIGKKAGVQQLCNSWFPHNKG